MTRATVCFAVLLCVASVRPAHADRLWSPDTGVPVAIAPGASHATPLVHDNGASTLVWSEVVDGERDLVAQRLDPQGIPQWGAQGRVLVQSPTQETLLSLLLTSDGFIAVWFDRPQPLDNYDLIRVLAQRYTLSGEPVWDDGGDGFQGRVLLSHDGDYYTGGEFLFAGDGLDGFYLLHHQQESGQPHNLYLFHVMPDGGHDLAWPQDGVLVHQAISIGEIVLLADPIDHDAVYVFWKTGSPTYLRLQRVLSDGSLDWGPNGILPMGTHNGLYLNLCSDGTGGVYALSRYLSTFDVQRVDSNATRMWGNPPPTIPAAGTPHLIPSANQTAIVLYESSQEDHVLGMRFGGTDFTPLWPEDHVLTSGIRSTDVQPDGQGGAVFLVEHADGDRSLQQVDSTGTALCDPAATRVMDPEHDRPTMAVGADGSVTLAHVTKLDLEDGYRWIHPTAHRFDTHRHEVMTGHSGVLLDDDDHGPVALLHTFRSGDTIWTVCADERLAADFDRGPRITMQGLDRATGQPLLDEPIDLLPGDRGPSYPRVAAREGGVFLSWSDYLTMHLTKVTTDGDHPWGRTGFQFDWGGGFYWSNGRQNLLPQPDGGLILIAPVTGDHPELGQGRGILAQRYAPDGTPLWSDDGVLPFRTLRFVDTTELLCSLVGACAMPDGTTLVEYYTRPSQSPYYPYIITYLLLDEDGTVLRETTLEGGNEIFPGRHNPIPFQGGFLASYGHQIMLYGADGQPAWDEGVTVPPYATQFVVRDPDADSFWAVCIHPDWVTELSAIHISAAGTPLSGPTTILVDTQGEEHDFQTLAFVDDDNNLTLFYRTAESLYERLLHRVIHPDGSFADGFEDAGVPIVDNPYQRTSPRAVADGLGGVVVAWTDYRTGGYPYSPGVFAQRFDNLATWIGPGDDGGDDDLAGDPGRPFTWAMTPAYPNPFNATATVTITLPRQGWLRLSVVDVLGREVQVIHNAMQQAGQQRFVLDGHEWASGIYFIRAESNGHPALIQKMVLLK